MLVPALSFISILFTALAMATAAAHAFELPNKMRLSEPEYLTAQRLYRGWALLGVFEIIAFVSAVLLLFVVRDNPAAFVPSLLAAIFLLAMQAVFWIFTFPVNRHAQVYQPLPWSH